MRTNIRVTQHIWDALLDREDKQIGVQEMMALALPWGTFGPVLGSALLLMLIDNDGVLAAILKGASRCPKVNMTFGQLWLEFACHRVGFAGYRAESKANIADGPTRDHFVLLEELGAQFVEPVLPPWVEDLWGPILDPAMPGV